MNVDIFKCIHFREIMKIGNFACIKICFLGITDSLWYYKSNFQGVHIFSQISRKRKLSENMYSAKISTLSVWTK